MKHLFLIFGVLVAGCKKPDYVPAQMPATSGVNYYQPSSDTTTVASGTVKSTSDELFRLLRNYNCGTLPMGMTNVGGNWVGFSPGSGYMGCFPDDTSEPSKAMSFHVYKNATVNGKHFSAQEISNIQTAFDEWNLKMFNSATTNVEMLKLDITTLSETEERDAFFQPNADVLGSQRADGFRMPVPENITFKAGDQAGTCVASPETISSFNTLLKDIYIESCRIEDPETGEERTIDFIEDVKNEKLKDILTEEKKDDCFQELLDIYANRGDGRLAFKDGKTTIQKITDAVLYMAQVNTAETIEWMTKSVDSSTRGLSSNLIKSKMNKYFWVMLRMRELLQGKTFGNVEGCEGKDDHLFSNDQGVLRGELVEYASSHAAELGMKNTLAVTLHDAISHGRDHVRYPRLDKSTKMKSVDVFVNSVPAFNGRTFWETGYDMTSTLLHEFGHAMGLEHEGKEYAGMVMAPTVRKGMKKVNALSRDRFRMYCMNYGNMTSSLTITNKKLEPPNNTIELKKMLAGRLGCQSPSADE